MQDKQETCHLLIKTDVFPTRTLYCAMVDLPDDQVCVIDARPHELRVHRLESDKLVTVCVYPILSGVLACASGRPSAPHLTGEGDICRIAVLTCTGDLVLIQMKVTDTQVVLEELTRLSLYLPRASRGHLHPFVTFAEPFIAAHLWDGQVEMITIENKYGDMTWASVQISGAYIYDASFCSLAQTPCIAILSRHAIAPAPATVTFVRVGTAKPSADTSAPGAPCPPAPFMVSSAALNDLTFAASVPESTYHIIGCAAGLIVGSAGLVQLVTPAGRGCSVGVGGRLVGHGNSGVIVVERGVLSVVDVVERRIRGSMTTNTNDTIYRAVMDDRKGVISLATSSGLLVVNTNGRHLPITTPASTTPAPAVHPASCATSTANGTLVAAGAHGVTLHAPGQLLELGLTGPQTPCPAGTTVAAGAAGFTAAAGTLVVAPGRLVQVESGIKAFRHEPLTIVDMNDAVDDVEHKFATIDPTSHALIVVDENGVVSASFEDQHVVNHILPSEDIENITSISISDEGDLAVICGRKAYVITNNGSTLDITPYLDSSLGVCSCIVRDTPTQSIIVILATSNGRVTFLRLSPPHSSLPSTLLTTLTSSGTPFFARSDRTIIVAHRTVTGIASATAFNIDTQETTSVQVPAGAESISGHAAGGWVVAGAGRAGKACLATVAPQPVFLETPGTFWTSISSHDDYLVVGGMTNDENGSIGGVGVVASVDVIAGKVNIIAKLPSNEAIGGILVTEFGLFEHHRDSTPTPIGSTLPVICVGSFDATDTAGKTGTIRVYHAVDHTLLYERAVSGPVFDFGVLRVRLPASVAPHARYTLLAVAVGADVQVVRPDFALNTNMRNFGLKFTELVRQNTNYMITKMRCVTGTFIDTKSQNNNSSDHNIAETTLITTCDAATGVSVLELVTECAGTDQLLPPSSLLPPGLCPPSTSTSTTTARLTLDFVAGEATPGCALDVQPVGAQSYVAAKDAMLLLLSTTASNGQGPDDLVAGDDVLTTFAATQVPVGRPVALVPAKVTLKVSADQVTLLLGHVVFDTGAVARLYGVDGHFGSILLSLAPGVGKQFKPVVGVAPKDPFIMPALEPSKPYSCPPSNREKVYYGLFSVDALDYLYKLYQNDRTKLISRLATSMAVFSVSPKTLEAQLEHLFNELI